MARKQKPKQTEAQLVALKGRLEGHRDKLIALIMAHVGDGHLTTFDGTVTLRNMAQHLVSTTLAIDNIPLYIGVAKQKGEVACSIDLEACGLESQ